MSVLLLEHKEDLIQCVTQLRPIMEFLETAKEEFLTGSEKRVTVSVGGLFLPSEFVWHFKKKKKGTSFGAHHTFYLAVFFHILHSKHLEAQVPLRASLCPLQQLAGRHAHCSQSSHLHTGGWTGFSCSDSGRFPYETFAPRVKAFRRICNYDDISFLHRSDTLFIFRTFGNQEERKNQNLPPSLHSEMITANVLGHVLPLPLTQIILRWGYHIVV